MRRPRTKARLSKNDVHLIVEMVCWAMRRGMTVAEAVQERLGENEVDLRGYRRELESAPRASTAKMLEVICARLEADSSRVRRLMSMFASWRFDAAPVDALREQGQL